MEIIKEEVLAFISKVWIWACYIFIGLIGRLSYNLIMGKRLSWLQIFASIGIALFCGFISSVVCANNFPERGAYVVPVATLLSEKIVVAFMAVDYKSLVADIAQYWADKAKK